ncbi:MAG: adenylate/guanylate cyclase domain-containing protein [Gammaproteobacteria bacterium]
MPSFDDVLASVSACLEQEGRVSYRMLKRRFELDDDDIEDIKAELVEAKQLARDENGRVLVWRGGTAPPPAEATRLPASADGEAADRRLITVMFCDIVGSTELSARFDAESLREIVRRYQETCSEIIAGHEGHVAQYLGDGLLVYFGYPVALEDEADKAVRAALAILQTLAADSELSERLGKPLQVRIGVHTGPVVIGEMGGAERAERLALGETPNIAARVQSAARPNEVLITAATLRLVEGLYHCEQHGPHQLKGVADAVTLFTVKGPSRAVSRFEVALSTGLLTPWVGRDNELGTLASCWEQVTRGHGQVVLVSGDAGIGKSRLAHTFKDSTGADARQMTLRCSPNHQSSAYYPLLHFLRQLCEVDVDDDDTGSVERLERTLAQYAFPRAHAAPLLASLLGIEHPRDAELRTLDSAARKRATFELLAAWFLEEAAGRPVVMTWDDVHWLDKSSHEFLAWFLEHVPAARIMLVLVFRSDYTPPWAPRAYLNHLVLSGLPDRDVDTMVGRLTGRELPEPTLEFIRSKTDGVPLYVEELTRSLIDGEGLANLESGELSSRSGAAIPTTLRDSLEARLDSCPAGKEVAQWGAVIGREFRLDLLTAVMAGPERLKRGLRELLSAELVYRSGTPADPAFIFKHALLRDTAYESLLTRELRRRHALIAETLEADFPHIAEREPELLAHHYIEAGLEGEAIEQLVEAAESAVERAAEPLAVQHLQLARELLARQPQSDERRRWEARVLLLLGPLLSSSLGAGSLEVRQTYERAVALCKESGDERARFRALFGLRHYHLAVGDLRRAHDIASVLYSAATRAGQPEYLLEAKVALVTSHFFLGEMAACREQAEKALAIYDPALHGKHAYTYGNDPGSLCRVRLAAVDLLQGRLEEASAGLEEACALADRIAHPASRAFAHGNAAECHALLEDYERAAAEAAVVREIAEQSSFPYWRAWSDVVSGRALAAAGDAQGIELARSGIAALDQAIGDDSLRRQVMYPWFLAQLAAAHGDVGQAEQGLALMPEALSLMNKHGLRFMQAAAYRIRGDLLHRMQLLSEAQRSLNEALALSEQCDTPFHGALAAASLAQLLGEQGRDEEAASTLAPYRAILDRQGDFPALRRAAGG